MKKILLIMLSTVMCIGLTACGCNHENAEWNMVGVDYVSALEEYEKKCPDCGENIDVKFEPLENLVNGTEFFLTPDEFGARMDNKFEKYLEDYLGDTDIVVSSGYTYDENGNFCYNLVKEGETFATIYLMNLADKPSVQEYDHFQMACAVLQKDENELGNCMFHSVISTLDPAIDDEGIETIVDQIMENEYPYAEKNGLCYAVSEEEEIISLYIGILDE